MRKRAVILLATWMAGATQAIVIYSNDFSGAAGTPAKIDWDSFIEYVVNSHNYQMLEKRCGKLACLEVKAEGVELSEIGLEYSKEIVVQVRKK